MLNPPFTMFVVDGFFFEGSMTSRHYRELLFRALRSSDGEQLGLIIDQLADAERAREILRAKGYGASGMNASTTAAQVPNAPRKD